MSYLLCVKEWTPHHHPPRGHRHVKMELAHWFKKKKKKELDGQQRRSFKRQVTGGVTDILLTVCHKDNSSKRNYYHLVFT